MPPVNADLNDHARVNIYDENTQTETSYKYSDCRQYRLQVERFVEAVQNPNTDYFTLENSKNNQLVIDAIFRAGKSGDWEYI